MATNFGNFVMSDSPRLLLGTGVNLKSGKGSSPRASVNPSISALTTLATGTSAKSSEESPARKPIRPSSPVFTAPVTGVVSGPSIPAATVAAFQPTVIPTQPFFPSIPFIPFNKTNTQLARGAINQLNGVDRGVLDRTLNVLGSKNLSASRLMDYLERKVKIGVVLNSLAENWDNETKKDFEEAIPGANENTIRDSIISLAILNEPTLEEEIFAENAPEATGEDLQTDRVIVDQYPPAGSVLEPPYVILVAVEQRDIVKAEEVVKEITDQLTTTKGFKLPKVAAAKLS